MSQLLRRLLQNGAVPGVIILLSQCSGSDITLPSGAAPASISKIAGDGQTGPAGARLAPLKVKVVDRSGDPVPSQEIAFSLDQVSLGAEVTPVATTDTNGEATAEWVLGATVGTQTVTASVVGKDDLQVTFEAVAGPAEAARLEYARGDAQTAAVGTALPNPLVVRVTDPFGNPISGVTVEWQAGSGSVDPSSSVTGLNGEAEASWVLGSSTGTQTATATSGQLEGSPITFSATATPGTASRLVLVSGNNQSAPPGAELPEPLVVRLVDEQGNGVPGRAVSWVIGVGGGTVSSATATTDGNGEAQVRWTLGSGSGLNTLTAVVSGVGVVSFRATATAGGGGGGGGSSPSRLRFVVQPSDTEEKARISPPVEVEIVDQNGARVTDDDREIKLELSGDDDGELKGGDTRRARSGLATFDDLEVDKEGEYRLRATADGLPAVESNTFEVHDDDRGGD